MFVRTRTFTRLAAVGAALTAATTGMGGTAHADVTRCVGAVGVAGASACYTSPRFDHIGLARTSVAPTPVVCYGLGCTGAELLVFVPADPTSGRFTTVTYFGNTYTVYRPVQGQPTVVRSSSATFQPAEDIQALLISVALEASQA